MGINQSNSYVHPSISYQTVTDFSAKRYQGLWYELAKYKTSTCVSSYSKYTWNLGVKNMSISTTCVRNAVTGGDYTIDMTAYPTRYSGKYIIKLGKTQYSYWVHWTDYTNFSIVGSPSGDFLWILGRRKHISYTDKQKVINIVRKYGYISSRLVWNFYPIQTNIKKKTLSNKNYMQVISTVSDMQVAVMTLKPSQFIDWEKHNGSQFIRVESGIALVMMGGEELLLRDGDTVVIPKDVLHYVSNNSKSEMLKLYTIYSSPEHTPDEIISKD